MHADGQRRHHQRLPGSYRVVAARRRRRCCRRRTGPRVGRRDDDARQALHRGGVGWAEPWRICDAWPCDRSRWDVRFFLEAHALPYANV